MQLGGLKRVVQAAQVPEGVERLVRAGTRVLVWLDGAALGVVLGMGVGGLFPVCFFGVAGVHQ